WDGLEQRRLFEGRDLPVTTDFRSVIASVIGDHMQLSQSQLATVFPDFRQNDKALKDIVRA
ncbi:MAG TPA: hypothetical protein V6D17_21255, partial [Candidatus Obscuribacterales bacterium]